MLAACVVPENNELTDGKLEAECWSIAWYTRPNWSPTSPSIGRSDQSKDLCKAMSCQQCARDVVAHQILPCGGMMHLGKTPPFSCSFCWSQRSSR